MSARFDPNIPPTGPGTPCIEGDFKDPVIIAEYPTFGLSNLIVNEAKPFDIKLSWHIFGNLVPVWLPALADTSPNWVVKAYAEPEGPGDGAILGKMEVPVAAVPPRPYKEDEAYEAKLTVPANTLSAETPDNLHSGVYKIVVTVFLGSATAPTGYEMMGYAEGPVIEVVR